MKRAVLMAAALAVVAAPAPAAIAKSKPKIPACFSFADAANDSGPGVPGAAPAGDPTMDLVNVRFSTVDKALVMQLKVGSYANRPKHAVGNRYQVRFDVDGKNVEIYWKDSPVRNEEANAFYQQGVRVDGTFKHDGVTGKASGNLVTMSVKLTMLKSAVASKVEGVRAGNVSALAMSSYVAQNLTWDTATGPESGFVIGGACK